LDIEDCALHNSKQSISIANVVSFLKKALSKIVFVKGSMECQVEPVHLRRTDERIKAVNAISKSLDSDNWSRDQNYFMELHAEFNFQVDLFANNSKARLRRFFSEFYCNGSERVEALAPWAIGSL
jgi:hypothetical protein